MTLAADGVKKNKRLNLTMKTYFTSSKVERYESNHLKRFLNHIRTLKWGNNLKKVYIRVSYGKKECNKGCICTFYNDGEYTNKKEFNQAFLSFIEDYHDPRSINLL